jgi:hypothetical protein
MKLLGAEIEIKYDSDEELCIPVCPILSVMEYFEKQDPRAMIKKWLCEFIGVRNAGKELCDDYGLGMVYTKECCTNADPLADDEEKDETNNAPLASCDVREVTNEPLRVELDRSLGM